MAEQTTSCSPCLHFLFLQGQSSKRATPERLYHVIIHAFPCFLFFFFFLPSLSTLALIPAQIYLPIIFLFLLVYVRNNFVIVCLSWSIHSCLSGQFMFSSSSLITIPRMPFLFGLDQNECFSGVFLKKIYICIRMERLENRCSELKELLLHLSHYTELFHPFML